MKKEYNRLNSTDKKVLKIIDSWPKDKINDLEKEVTSRCEDKHWLAEHGIKFNRVKEYYQKIIAKTYVELEKIKRSRQQNSYRPAQE
ncbi:MAG: hypothetical protein WC475_03875 [Candidatus Paceibacterota bacterium]